MNTYPLNESGEDKYPEIVQSLQSSVSVLKKTSPLKHVTPIIRKYDCQRQAKNGKTVTLKSKEKMSEKDASTQKKTQVQDLVASMDSLDAALRRAEKCIASNKELDSQDYPADQGIEPNGDDLNDVEEENFSSSVVSSSQQNASSNRPGHLRNRNRVLKKRNQLQKDLEHALPLAVSNEYLISNEKSHAYATSFYMKVKERYETLNPTVYSKFVDLLNDFSDRPMSVPDLYHRVINLLKDSPDICEEFLLFLYPEQASQCGKFMEHLACAQMASFQRKLELYFSKQPQHLKKIIATLTSLSETPDLTLETVRNTMIPLLRNNTFLIDSFLELLPSSQPPESKMTDFDLVICDDLDSEHSGEEEVFERIEVPPETDDPYGGENCQCCCHSVSDPIFNSRSKHCVPCGIKFISGKVFMQTEHGLRPVTIEFSGKGSTHNNIKRLNADHQKLTRPRSRRGRTNVAQVPVKAEDCKQNVETDDEAAFTNKNRSPRQRPKITKIIREKQFSARALAINRKPAVGKLSSPTSVIYDQDAVSAPELEEQKHSILNFSNVLRKEQDTHENESKLDHNSLVNIQDNNHLLEKDEVLEKNEDECSLDNSNSEVLSCNRSGHSDSDERETESILKNEDADISMDELDEKVDEYVEDDKGCVNVSGDSSACDMEDSSEDSEGISWTREEDRVILCTFQSESDREKTLTKIKTELPHRSLNEISSRFQLLMSLIQKMDRGEHTQ